MRVRRMVLAGGLISSALVAVFGDRSSPGEVVLATHAAPGPAPTQRPAEAHSATANASDHVDVAPAGVLLLQDRVLPTSHTNEKPDVAPFGVLSWAPPPPAPSAPAKPSAPPLPFTYLGKELDGDQWRVFLARENEVLIVKANDIIGDTYRIEDIAPPTVTILYVPLNETQQLTIK
ncbi:hypothetical protein [Burkholderia sp. Ac-20353]|uniref:hypothetical protein n=1 Tax=Burkholderia sp. Ac-20353 TaxID=2703894 RepID=UPI00197B406B|nr:hypothetical protein [Burkholderia sp. Ac-20353]MBN3788935.1 hypothetical protein [Burkholderia sp. Ac-20353]